MTVRVLLVDDHRMMREGLAALLASQADIEVVGQAADGRSALDLVRTLAPDVVVMDIGMAEMNGIEATRSLAREHPEVSVIALSTHSDRLYVEHMLAAGARAYVRKSAAHAELLHAVRTANKGTRRRRRTGAAGSVFTRLGPREREVLQLVAEGRTSAEIAQRMHICLKTVETHRRNLAQKLGLRGTAELTKYAIREGLTSLDA